MRRKTYLPRPVLKGIIADIKHFIKDNEGRFIILEVAKEIPVDIRKQLLEELALFYDEDLAVFFRLILEEYEEELKPVCIRALTKYRMAGLDVEAVSFTEGSFYRAYASLSRQSGSITLEVAWRKENRHLDVECFHLSYGTEGIHSFLILTDMPLRKYEADHRQALDMVELGFEEACILIKEAYDVNRKNMTRPATGRFLYKKYLKAQVNVEEEELYSLTLKISADLMPRQLVNSFFYALKHKDYVYTASILEREKITLRNIKDLFSMVLRPGNLLLEARADDALLEGRTARVNGHLCIMEEKGTYKYTYVFKLGQDESLKWKICDVELTGKGELPFYLNPDADREGFSCLVYEILDIDELFIWLEEIRLLKVVEEIPRGIHLRVSPWYDENEWDNGISFLNRGEVDLVINGDELVVICLDSDLIADWEEEIEIELAESLEFKGRYVADLLTVYSYIEGQYASFEDVVISQDEREMVSGGMRFLSARYLVKNRDEVYKFLSSLNGYTYDLSGYHIFYQLEKRGEELLLEAEYILDGEYLTVSAFGEEELGSWRDNLWGKVGDHLEFIGMETRREGLFAVLTPEVKRAYPELEMLLKELYLNKWVKSSLPLLKGMTPGEAFQSLEGRRLLWDMFKQMKKSENNRQKKATFIKFRDYMSKLENRWKKIK